jgi:hypothetical protein
MSQVAQETLLSQKFLLRAKVIVKLWKQMNLGSSFFLFIFFAGTRA